MPIYGKIYTMGRNKDKFWNPALILGGVSPNDYRSMDDDNNLQMSNATTTYSALQLAKKRKCFSNDSFSLWEAFVCYHKV